MNEVQEEWCEVSCGPETIIFPPPKTGKSNKPHPVHTTGIM